MTSHSTGFVLAGAACIAVTFGLARYSFGLFVPAIQLDLDLRSATIGGIASLAYLSMAAAMLATPSRLQAPDMHPNP